MLGSIVTAEECSGLLLLEKVSLHRWLSAVGMLTGSYHIFHHGLLDLFWVLGQCLCWPMFNADPISYDSTVLY